MARPTPETSGLPAGAGSSGAAGPTRVDSPAPLGRASWPNLLDVAAGRTSGADLAPPEPLGRPDVSAGPLAPGLWDGVRPSLPDEPATVREIARQVAAQPVLPSGGGAELRLAPEELGQLRLSIESADGGLRVTIEATRPETADLLRRHVETLRQELRQEGLGSVSVSIGGGEAGPGTGRGNGPPLDSGAPGPAALAGGAETPAASVAALVAPPRPRPGPGQIDLRL
jgi:flagellar hook-length control protein FliK